jgi:hypothetical protein
LTAASTAAGLVASGIRSATRDASKSGHPPPSKSVLTLNTYNKVDHYVGDRYFSALHDKIRTILREKTHLIEGASMPESFYKYIQHSVMENIQINLWNEKQIDTLAVKGLKWPREFPEDVKAGLEAAMGRYEEILAELRST